MKVMGIEVCLKDSLYLEKLRRVLTDDASEGAAISLEMDFPVDFRRLINLLPIKDFQKNDILNLVQMKNASNMKTLEEILRIRRQLFLWIELFFVLKAKHDAIFEIIERNPEAYKEFQILKNTWEKNKLDDFDNWLNCQLKDI